MSLIFHVRDLVAETHSDPIIRPTTGAALREFSEAANDPEHVYYKHPDDYLLICIGAFDRDECTYELHERPTELGTARNFRVNGTQEHGKQPVQLRAGTDG